MKAIKKITSVMLSAAMFLSSGMLPSALANGAESVALNPQPVGRKPVDKRVIGAGIGAGVGIPTCCILLGCLIHHATHKAANSTVTAEKISEFENNFLNNFAKQVNDQKRGEACVSCKELVKTCNAVTPLLKNDGHVPSVNGPTIVVADLHGDFKAAKFYCDKFLEKLKSNPNTNIVFLGDYIDRGGNSIEILYMLFKLKIAFPKNVYLLMGNHESYQWGPRHPESLSMEIVNQYSTNANQITKTLYHDVFKCLPFAAVVNDSVFCVHGGISASRENKTEPIKLQQIRDLPPCSAIDINKIEDDGTSILGVASSDGFILNNLLWAEFRDNTAMAFDSKIDGGRNYSYPFGPDAVSAFLKKNQLKLMVRGHSHPANGKEESSDHKVITLLSAPRYCGVYQNNGYALYFTGVNSADGNPSYEEIICK